jgi:hypothetical protein
MPLTLLVMAAGLGSRYGGMKQLDPVGPGGETLLDYSVFDAQRAGARRLVFVIRRDMEAAFRASVGRRYEPHLQVDYAFQEITDVPGGFVVPKGRTRPWGTGHAVLAAAEVITGPFLVVNADDFYGRGSLSRLAAFLTDPPGGSLPVWALVTFRLRDTLSDHGKVARGVCETDDSGRLRGITEVLGIERDGDQASAPSPAGTQRHFTGDEAVSLNLWGFTPQVFGLLRQHFQGFLAARGLEEKAECFLPEAVNAFLAQGQAEVHTIPGEGPWFGLTHREDRPRVAERLAQLRQAGVYPKSLWG